MPLSAPFMPHNSIATASSKVQLTLMSLFHAHAGEVKPLVGTSRVQVRDGQFVVEAASVPFHNRAMDGYAPRSGCMLTLFGIRDALTELQHWRTVARSSKAHFGYLQLQVDVGEVVPGAVTRRLLQEHGQGLRFVNVRRSAAEFQKELLQQFATWLQEEGGDPRQHMSHVRHMALRPDFFARAFLQDPDLQHVDVMVLPLADKPDAAQVRQVALLRAGAQWTQLPQGSDQVQMQMPAWMGQGVVSGAAANHS